MLTRDNLKSSSRLNNPADNANLEFLSPEDKPIIFGLSACSNDQARVVRTPAYRANRRRHNNAARTLHFREVNTLRIRNIAADHTNLTIDNTLQDESAENQNSNPFERSFLDIAPNERAETTPHMDDDQSIDLQDI